MLNIVIIIIIGFVVFELIEHVVLPLFGIIASAKKKSLCGVTGMIGEVAEVKEWSKRKGTVFVHGELWSAVSDVPLSPGDQAVIQAVEGLRLKVILYKG